MNMNLSKIIIDNQLIFKLGIILKKNSSLLNINLNS